MSAHRRVLSARVKTSAAVVATGIGAVAAAGVLATPAAAAGGDAWAAVRQCESGGNYSINTVSGFYGAYQFTLQSWRSLGLSGLPSDAPPAVQDQAARRLAAQYGMKPWPVCGKRYGGPAPSSGGSASVQALVSRTTSSVPVPTQPSTASGYHRDKSPRSHWQSHNFPRHPNYRSHHSHRSYPTARSHWGYRSAPQSAGVVRVLSVRLVGQTRADVWLYQMGLDRVGYHLGADGRFGPLTRLSTMHFQAAHGLTVDGLAGPHTKALRCGGPSPGSTAHRGGSRRGPPHLIRSGRRTAHSPAHPRPKKTVGYLVQPRAGTRRLATTGPLQRQSGGQELPA